MVTRGYRTGGIVPFGYTTEVVRDAAGFHKVDREPPRRLIPDPENAAFVKGAFTLLVEEGNYGSVARYLNGVSSRQWSLKAVIDLLHNEVYKGFSGLDSGGMKPPIHRLFPPNFGKRCRRRT